jgi:hypothetical protein
MLVRMRLSLTVALLLVASCFGGSAPPPSSSSSKAIANVAPPTATLRIPRVAPRVGSVRTSRTVTRSDNSEVRKVTRSEVLAVDGFAATGERITYLEVDGAEKPLAGKTYVVTKRAGQIEVVPDEGTPPGNEELVRKDNRTAGQPDSTMMMVTDRQFSIGRTVSVRPPPSLPDGTKVTLTLRSFDHTTATFDMTVAFTTEQVGVKASGRMVIDRATGREILASMSTEYTIGSQVELGSIELEATTE